MSNALITQLKAGPLSNPATLQKINRQLAQGGSFVLVIVCAWLLVKITWMFVPQESAPLQAPSVKAQPRVPASSQQDNFNRLTAASLFGVSDRAPVKNTGKVPETRLNLTLKGVLAATPMERASAIIARGKNGKEDIYGVGDKMPGGVVIREIHPEHVILERGGKLETLKLQKLSAVSGGTGRRVGRASSYSSGRPSSPGAALKQIRSNIMKNPTSFGDYALPVVVKEKGKQVGYRLQPQEKGELLAELGIQPNDIITEINGVKLDKPQNGVSALRKLSTARTLNIVVKRNGAEIPLSISLQ
ncbi:MAG TPA: type II secretion system protein GspC [Gammaproteobacteria bacterium]|nr:type II secretion system protein GspC [Gammaproteobacteria bacterium]